MAWEGPEGLSPFVERLMTEGHRIGGDVPEGFCEVGQYEWKSLEAQRIGGMEAGRHVIAGAIEYFTRTESMVRVAPGSRPPSWSQNEVNPFLSSRLN